MGLVAIMGQLPARRCGSVWWRSLAACAIALALGLGQAHAEIENAHEGGQGRDKQASAFSAEKRFGGEAGVRAFAAATARAPDSLAEQPAEPAPVEQAADIESEATAQPEAVAAVDGEEDAAAPTTRTRTTTRSFVKDGYVVSRTRSKSISFDEEGNRAVARAVAKARAPNDVAAVETGAGRIVAKTSVDVTGNGAGSAAAGGSIGVASGKVDVATWGRTSAEVY